MCLIAPDWSSSRRVAVRLCASSAFIIVVALMSGCGKPFNIKPRTELPKANYTGTASTDRVTIQAEPIAAEDLLYETFDANLILAGVLPVRVMLTNSGEESLNLRDARFEVRTGQGRSFKSVGARQAFKRVVSYYEISTYTKSGFKESLEDFSAYALDMQPPLTARQSREGLVFFLVSGDVMREAGLILQISKLNSKQQPVQVKLN
jgi:hypothetical protein